MKSSSFASSLDFNDKKVSIKVILETEFSKEIRILMKDGQEMNEHKTPYPITVHLLRGKIDFVVENKVHNIVEGDILSLKGDIPHSLLAHQDSIIRLTLSKNDSVSRVQKVAG